MDASGKYVYFGERLVVLPWNLGGGNLASVEGGGRWWKLAPKLPPKLPPKLQPKVGITRQQYDWLIIVIAYLVGRHVSETSG